MTKRTKKPRDTNQLAKRVVDQATGNAPKDRTEPAAALPSTPKRDTRNPAAVALGKLGGAKGGPARAAKLSPKRRSEIATKAAAARWKGKPKRDRKAT